MVAFLYSPQDLRTERSLFKISDLKKCQRTINDSVWKYILKQCVKNIANCLATLEVPQYFFQNTTPNKLSYKKHFYQQVKCSSIIFLSA